MTRINIIEPSELTDQHLIAEYREIFMVGGSLRRTLKSKSGYMESKVPKKFTLNNGHVYFFYNKGKYLHNRYLQLIEEMKQRGFNPDSSREFPTDVFKNNGLSIISDTARFGSGDFTKSLSKSGSSSSLYEGKTYENRNHKRLHEVKGRRSSW